MRRRRFAAAGARLRGGRGAKRWCYVLLVPDAVIFDLDGVLLDSEQLWNAAKQALVGDAGGRWQDDAPVAMMGMSSGEWSTYMQEHLGVDLSVEEINRDVISRMGQLYRSGLPLLPGAVDAVRTLHARWPLGLASSSNREIIELVLELADLGELFVATVSSEEVARGKPAPDVYLETARRVGVEPGCCVAIEDSGNGMLAAVAAGMAVIAVPNTHYPPDPQALELAGVTVKTLQGLTPGMVERAHPGPEPHGA